MIGRSPLPQPRPPKIERTYIPGEPNVYVLQLHDHDCNCPVCEPYVPSVPARLTAADLGKLSVAGVIVASAIAFAIDPAGALAALLAPFAL